MSNLRATLCISDKANSGKEENSTKNAINDQHFCGARIICKKDGRID